MLFLQACNYKIRSTGQLFWGGFIQSINSTAVSHQYIELQVDDCAVCLTDKFHDADVTSDHNKKTVGRGAARRNSSASEISYNYLSTRMTRDATSTYCDQFINRRTAKQWLQTHGNSASISSSTCRVHLSQSANNAAWSVVGVKMLFVPYRYQQVTKLWVLRLKIFCYVQFGAKQDCKRFW